MANKPTGKEMASMFEDFVNTFDNKSKKEFAENIVYRTHRTLQQSMFAVFMECIKLWGVMYDQGNYDLRNEETCKKAHDIMKLFGEDATYLPLI